MPNPYRCSKECVLPSESDRESENDPVCPAKMIAEGLVLKADDNGHRALACPWQGWLLEWEERQRLQLKRHEEITQELLEGIRNDLIDSLAQPGKTAKPRSPVEVHITREVKSSCKQSHWANRTGRSVEFHDEVTFCGSGFEEKERNQREERALNRPPTAQSTDSVCGSRPSRQSALLDVDFQSSNGGVASQASNRFGATWSHGGTAAYTELNAAMLNACGGAKHQHTKASGSAPLRMTMSFTNLEQVMRVVSARVSDRLSERLSGGSNGGRKKFSCQRRLDAVVNHRYFSLVSSFLIGLYTVVVGVMADMEMKAAVAGQEVSPWRWWLDLFFTSSFGMEVLLRMSAENIHFFTGKEWNWNVFDSIVATVGLLDICTVFHINLGFLRILRTFRAVRVLRVIRVFPIFKELRLMVASIFACMVSLAWAFTLLVSVMYIFAVILLQGASDSLRTGTVPTELRGLLAQSFGSLPRTIYSLTQAVSGGRSWGEYAEPFIRISPWYGVCFTLFVVFTIFGVMNILTGLFVESTSTVANFDRELMIQESMSRNESVVNQIRQLFKELDADNSGTLSFAELQKNLNDERVKAYFALLQMDVSEAQGLFQLLDKDDDGEVSIEEFIMSCMRLKGAARSIDLAAMLFENKRLYSMMKTFMESIDELMRDLQEKVSFLATLPP